jgi:hypothetical protein
LEIEPPSKVDGVGHTKLVEEDLDHDALGLLVEYETPHTILQTEGDASVGLVA